MAKPLSVIIPSAGRRADMTQTLDALLGLPGLTGDDVTVVVDGPESAPPCDRPVQWLWTGLPSGPACARNLGAASASGDILLFIDDDVHPDTGALDAMQRMLESGADAACAVVRPAPGVPDNVYIRFAYSGAAHGGEGDWREPWWHFCTSLAMVRRNVFDAVGGFDERFQVGSAYEEVDLAFRIDRSGATVGICSDAVAWHRRHMDRGWFIGRGECQGAQLARLLDFQPALEGRRHRIMKRLGVVSLLLASGWRGGCVVLPVVERLPPSLATVILGAILACGISRSFVTARCSPLQDNS